ETRRDDLARGDRGHPPDGQEHVPPAGDLAHESDDTRRAVLAEHHDDVADLAQAVAGRVEDGAPGQARDEEPLCADGPSVAPVLGRSADVSLPTAQARRRGRMEA